MSIQKIIGFLLLAVGICFGIAILVSAVRDKEIFRQENGRFSLFCLLETGIFFCATLGVSDYLLNTLVFRKLRVSDVKNLPGTNCACSLLPGAVIACFLLQAENPVNLSTLIPCVAAIIVGAQVGSRLVRKLDGKVIKKALGYALIASMVTLIIRIIVSRGTPGTLTGLSDGKLVIALVFSFLWGAFSMLGVPLKPAATALFLLLGLSPLITLTLLLVLGCVGPLGGGIPVLKGGRYSRKMTSAAATFGTLGAVIGSLLALSMNAALLNVLLLVVMLIAIISLFRD